jgi:phosphoribosylformylglycinamidine cyclo-ligase
VGFSSYGQATYETAYNSGLGSNGLTSARHDVLHHDYATKYPETFEPRLKEEVVYLGKNKMTDEIEVAGFGKINMGKLLLSPTRTYAPLVKEILTQHFDAVKGMIHCSGGGQTKCMKYLPGPMRLVKDNFLPIPPIFKLIQENSGANTREMYQVFNMGHRLEIFTEPKQAQALIDLAKTFNIQAQIIGKVEAAAQKELVLSGDFGQETFTY